MKKSELRKIIREVIQEQTVIGPPLNQNTRKGYDASGNFVSVPGKPPTNSTVPHTFGTSPAKVKMTPEIQNRINTINSLFLLGPCAGYNVDCADTNPLINAASNTLVAMLNAVFFVPESLYDLVTGVDYSENPEAIPGGLQYTMNIMADVLPSDCCQSPLWALCTPEGQNMLDSIINQIHPTFQSEIEVGNMTWCPYNPPY